MIDIKAAGRIVFSGELPAVPRVGDIVTFSLSGIPDTDIGNWTDEYDGCCGKGMVATVTWEVDTSQPRVAVSLKPMTGQDA